jgi:hypothetical protein
LRNITPKEAFTRVKPEVGTLQDIWVSCIHSCIQGERDQARPFRKKEYICGVQ